MITLTPSSTVPHSYSVNWSAQQSHILEGLRNLVNGQDDLLLTDVTLACDGEYVQAHKLVLSLCSSFFKDLFQKNRADKSNAIVILGNNVSAQDLCYLLQFMYVGRVDIPSKDVKSFLEAGNALKVEGLIRNARNEFQEPPVSGHSGENPNTSSVTVNIPSHSEPQPVQSTSSSSRSFAPAWSAEVSSSDISQSKKRRLCETEVSTSDADGSDALLPPKIVSTASRNMDQSSADPLDLDGTEGAQFHSGEMEADIEEHLNLRDVKSEPIPILIGCEESGRSEMTVGGERIDQDAFEESLGDDTYGLQPPEGKSSRIVRKAREYEEGDHSERMTNDDLYDESAEEDSYGLPPPEGNVSIALSLPVSLSVSKVNVPGPSTTTHSHDIGKFKGDSSNSKKRKRDRPRVSLSDPEKSSQDVRNVKARGSKTGSPRNNQVSRGQIWEYFELITTEEKEGKLRTGKTYRCKICQKLIKSSGRFTGNLWTHLRHQHSALK